ncbi:MAG: AI-2E family transporter [Clostridiales bacterium]|nr:AI-2E family transporter [Candidatus Equinaster intestinalis]
MKLEENTNKKDKKYFFKVGLTAFLTVSAIILFFFLIFKFSTVLSVIGKLIYILEPIILGAVIAYLLNPIQKFFSKYILKLLRKIFKKNIGFEKASLIISIAFSMLLFVFVIIVFFYLVIPEFSGSIVSLINTLPPKAEHLVNEAELFLKDNEKMLSWINDFYNSQKSFFDNFVVTNANSLASTLATGVLDVINFLKDFVIGIIVAFYILASKSKFKAQFKKILCALFKQKKVNTVLRGMRKCDSIFGGFINGKLLDSLIIGVLCFIGTTILRIPYTMLISVIIGVTNIIPVFGPYIGGAICGILLLLDSPIKCLYFVIFIILLQALDGNVIGPKILGDSTGLSAFWVMVSIIVGGGLFGVLGMLLGVPTFAVIYYIIKTFLYRALKKKKLPTDTELYTDINKIYNRGEVSEDDQEPVIQAE